MLFSEQYFWMGLNILQLFVMILFIPGVLEAYRFKEQKFWYVYGQTNDEGKRPYTTGLHGLGRFKEFRRDEARQRYEIIFADGFRHRHFYSTYTADQLLTHYQIHRYVWIRYALNLRTFRVPLPEHQWFTRKSVLPWYYHGFRVLEYLLSFTSGAHGFFGSLLVGVVFVSCGYKARDALVYLQLFFIGLAVGVIVSLVLTYLIKNNIVKVEMKDETVTYEDWLEPLTPDTVFVDYYDVEVNQQVAQEQDDGTADPGTENRTYEHIDLFTLNALRVSPSVKIVSWKLVETRRVEMKPEEILGLEKDLNYRMQTLWEDNHLLRNEVARLQDANTELIHQVQSVQSQMDIKLREYNQRMFAERERGQENLKTLAIRFVGEAEVGSKWQDTVKEAYVDFKMLKERILLDRLAQILVLQEAVLEKSAKAAGISVADLKRELGIGALTPDNGGNGTGVQTIQAQTP